MTEKSPSGTIERGPEYTREDKERDDAFLAALTNIGLLVLTNAALIYGIYSLYKTPLIKELRQLPIISDLHLTDIAVVLSFVVLNGLYMRFVKDLVVDIVENER